MNDIIFAQGLCFYKLFWVFMLGNVLGCIVEMLFCYAQNGHFESRAGVVYGPLNPVYGFGAVLLTLSLHPFVHWNAFLLFIASGIIGGTFEWICSLLQEKVFHSVSWEYSDTPMNVGGRTNLKYSIYWGILGLVFIRSTYPFMSEWIEKIPNTVGVILTWILFTVMLADILVSAAAVKRKMLRAKGIAAGNRLAKWIDSRFPDERINKIYPNMTAVEKPRG